MTYAIFPVPWDDSDRRQQDRTVQRLYDRYGADRAQRILTGNCHLTNLDIAKWRALGAGKDAA